MAVMYQVVVVLMPTLLSVACSPRPQVHPTQTAPVPVKVRISEECSTAGKLLCGAVSMVSGDGAVERTAACFAYIEQSGRRVEQCESVPASQPSSNSRASDSAGPTKTARLSWKDNSDGEDGFRVYRIVGDQITKIAELKPNTTNFVDPAAPQKACYVVVAFNSAGESAPTAKACLSE